MPSDLHLPDEGKEVFANQNYGRRLGFGKSGALLVVDFVNGFTDPTLFGSSEMQVAIGRTRPLLEAARNAKIPIVYTRIVYANDRSDLGIMGLKVPSGAVLTEQHWSSQVVDELQPRDGEIVVRKRYPSAFFATDLASLLHLRGVDMLFVTGCSTSGCVQASVVDAMGHGFRPIVVADCVADRHLQSHQMALLNMDMKYGDVVESSEVVAWLHG
ncbi:MAG: isochorismatase family protein [Burkholderiaceae bacterium]